MVRSSPPNSAVRAGWRWRSSSAWRNPARPLPPLPPADLRQGGTVPPNPQEVAGCATEGRDRGRATTPAGPVQALLQHRSAPQSPRPAHPGAEPTPADPRPSRPGRSSPPTTGSGPTRSTAVGSVTVRHNSRLHHIGLGARLAGTPISLLIDDLHVRVIHRHTGQLIRELILDPTRDYQPRGLPPDHPNATPAATPPAASRSRPNMPRHRSRSQGWPQATRRAPALTPGEDDATITSRDAETPTTATMSQDTRQRCPETSHSAPSRIRTCDTRLRNVAERCLQDHHLQAQTRHVA